MRIWKSPTTKSESDPSAECNKYQLASVSGVLPESDDYIDVVITSEYEFQRNELYSVRGHPILGPGLAIMIGLAAFLFSPSNATVQIAHPKVATASLIIYGLSAFSTLVCGLLLGRKRHPKIDAFAVEDLLARASEAAVQEAYRAKPLGDTPSLDATVRARVRSEKLAALREQIALCRKENLYRHCVSVVLLISLYLCILSGTFLAMNFVGAHIPQSTATSP